MYCFCQITLYDASKRHSFNRFLPKLVAKVMIFLFFDAFCDFFFDFLSRLVDFLLISIYKSEKNA